MTQHELVLKAAKVAELNNVLTVDDMERIKEQIASLYKLPAWSVLTDWIASKAFAYQHDMLAPEKDDGGQYLRELRRRKATVQGMLDVVNYVERAAEDVEKRGAKHGKK